MGWAQMVQSGINAANELVKGRQEANRLRDQAEIVQQDIDKTVLNQQLSAQQYSAREESLRRNIRSQLGAQSAAIAESGTGFGGSNLAVQRQSEAASELDVLNLRYQGQLERMGMDIDLANLHYNKTALRKAAKTAMRMRWHNAGAAFFGAGTVSASGGGGTTAPTTGGGIYGQGSVGNFGNNMGSFTSGAYGGSGSSSAFGGQGGFTGGGLGGGYGSVGGFGSLFGGG